MYLYRLNLLNGQGTIPNWGGNFSNALLTISALYAFPPLVSIGFSRIFPAKIQNNK